MLGVAAESLVWLGRWEEADQLFDEVFELDMPASEWVDALLSRSDLSLCRGDHDAVRTDLAQDHRRLGVHTGPAAGICIVQAEMAIAEGRFADARDAVSDGLSALASSIDPVLVVDLCAVGLATEAGTAERAGVLRAAAEHEDAVVRAAALLKQANAAVIAEGT